MNEHFVTSLEWSKRLKKAGVPQVSEFYWIKAKYDKDFHLGKWKNQEEFDKDEKNIWNGLGISSYLEIEVEQAIEWYSAYLSDELAGMLPDYIEIRKSDRRSYEAYKCWYPLPEGEKDYPLFGEKYLPNALAAMVEYCKQKGLI